MIKKGVIRMKDEERKTTVRLLNDKINALKDKLAISYAKGNGKHSNKLDIDRLMNEIDRAKEIRKRLMN